MWAVLRLLTLFWEVGSGSVGFTAASATRTTPPPLAPTQFSSIGRGPNSGQAVVKVESQIGAIAFDVHYALEGTDGVLSPWAAMTLTSPRKVTISGLTPAGTYQFQVRALGKLGYTEWSPSMTFISA
jgi:hypothetical protein